MRFRNLCLVAVLLGAFHVNAQAQLSGKLLTKYQVPVGGGFTDVTGVFDNPADALSTVTITDALLSADNPGLNFFSPLQDDLTFNGPIVLNPGDSANYDDVDNFKMIARLTPDSLFPPFRTSEVTLTLQGFLGSSTTKTDLGTYVFTYENLNVTDGKTPVPEPGTVALVLATLTGGSILAARRVRRQR
jgi:hypothetical protein